MQITTRPAPLAGHRFVRVHASVPAAWVSARAGAGRGSVREGLASEHAGGYRAQGPDAGAEAADADADADAAAGGSARAPFGLPVLAELPRLATVLERLAVADRAMSDAVVELAVLLRDDQVERTTGVDVEHWLATVGRSTRMDRRLLVRTCRLLQRLPTLDAAVRDGRVSFAQLRGLALALRGVRRELDVEVDRLLAALLAGLDRLERPDPDVLVRQVADGVDELDPGDLAEREHDAVADRFLALQPRLDGTGGKVSGDLDAAGLALVDAATAPSPELIARAGGVGAARAELLLARLAASDAPDLRTGDPDPERGPGHGSGEGGAHGQERGVVAGPGEDGTGSVWGRLAPPRLVLRLRFESLLDPSVPGELLTSLVGGRLKLTGAAARRLIDERGALLRTVVVDDTGAVLGVGRTSRRPPGWMADVVAAVHDTCTGPGCDRPARTGQLDHAVPWWPTGPDDPGGATGVDNLGPLCGATNREKEAAGWQVAQSVGGVRTWTHARSGLACTTVPSTWRPAGDPRDDRDQRHGRRDGPRDGEPRHRRRSDGSDPPGPEGPGPGQHASDGGDEDLPF